MGRIPQGMKWDVSPLVEACPKMSPKTFSIFTPLDSTLDTPPTHILIHMRIHRCRAVEQQCHSI